MLWLLQKFLLYQTIINRCRNFLQGQFFFFYTNIEEKYFFHGRIINWTQHKGCLTLAEMAQVVEGNHGNDSKDG